MTQTGPRLGQGRRHGGLLPPSDGHEREEWIGLKEEGAVWQQILLYKQPTAATGQEGCGRTVLPAPRPLHLWDTDRGLLVTISEYRIGETLPASRHPQIYLALAISHLRSSVGSCGMPYICRYCKLIECYSIKCLIMLCLVKLYLSTCSTTLYLWDKSYSLIKLTTDL